jgi:hypothetical protein
MQQKLVVAYQLACHLARIGPAVLAPNRKFAMCYARGNTEDEISCPIVVYDRDQYSQYFEIQDCQDSLYMLVRRGCSA